jgi:hypothetical protein
MHFMLDARGDTINQQLTDYYEYFNENLHEIQNIKEQAGGQFISLLAWLKYYAQMYAFALDNDSRENVLLKIDQLLTNMNTPFCSTLKLFIVKQILQISKLNLNDLREVHVNRNVVWMKSFLLRPPDQQAQDIRRNLVLPTPLFECREDFQRISRVLNETDKVDELRRVIRECSTTQKLSYAFLCWFVQYYCSTH